MSTSAQRPAANYGMAVGYQDRPGVYCRIIACALNLLEKTQAIPSREVAISLFHLLPMRLLEMLKDEVYSGLRFSNTQKYESISNRFADGSEGTFNILCKLSEDYLPNQFLSEELIGLLTASLELYEKQSSSCPIAIKFQNLASLFKLDETSLEVLWLKYLFVTNEDYVKLQEAACKLTGAFSGAFHSGRGYLAPVYTILINKPLTELNAVLSNEGALQQAGLLDGEQALASEIVDYLSGHSDTPLLNHYYKPYDEVPLDLEQFTVEPKQITMLQKMLQPCPGETGLNILFYGQPGTGKTELARALGQGLGLNVYEISASSDNLKVAFRLRALQACESQVDPQTSLIIIDEADHLLNSYSSFFHSEHTMEKGRLNMLLDQSKCRRIWITNQYDSMDESSMRRFDYSLHFSKLTFQQRKTIWSNCAEKHGIRQLFQDEDFEKLADTYESNAGAIDSTLRACQRLYAGQDTAPDLRETIDTLMRSHLQRMEQAPLRANSKTANTPDYGLEGLNINGDLSKTLNILQGFNKHWDQPVAGALVKNMNLLLYGPPGTGKTEFAKYVARALKRRLIIKSGSDLLSKWVGETEKNIRAMFEEAQQEKAILFVDEADGLFAGRDGASQRWEVTQANELLTNMEQFEGILICSTNFKSNLDEAAIRRFNLKLEFDFLQAEGNQIFYERFLSKLISQPLHSQASKALQTIKNLAPGDFKIVYQQHIFLDSKNLTHFHLIRALCEEVRHKNKSGEKIGFGR